MISPYLIVLAIVVLAPVAAKRFPQWDTKIYNGVMILLTVFLCCRYAQGSDYHSYEMFYNSSPWHITFNHEYFSKNFHAEILWKITMMVFHSMRMPFFVFVIVLSMGMMFCLKRFIDAFSPYKYLSVILSYSTLYLMYFSSTLRQATAVAVFMGFMVFWLIDGSKKALVKYYIVGIILCLVHSGSAVLLIVPIFVKIKSFKPYLVALIACFIIGFVPIAFTQVHDFLATLPKFSSYMNDAIYLFSFSTIFSLGKRLAVAAVLLCVLLYTKVKKIEVPIFFTVGMKVYLLGLCLYGAFLFSPFIGGRIFIPFEAFKIALLPVAMSLMPKDVYKKALYVILVVASILLTCRNLGASAEQRNYFDTTWWKYPYITIFDPLAWKQYMPLPDYRIELNERQAIAAEKAREEAEIYWAERFAEWAAEDAAAAAAAEAETQATELAGQTQAGEQDATTEESSDDTATEEAPDESSEQAGSDANTSAGLEGGATESESTFEELTVEGEPVTEGAL